MKMQQSNNSTGTSEDQNNKQIKEWKAQYVTDINEYYKYRDSNNLTNKGSDLLKWKEKQGWTTLLLPKLFQLMLNM
jgi:hypothetical protein